MGDFFRDQLSETMKNLDFTLQGGAPPSYKWVIIPLTVDITPRNPSYSTYKPSQLTMGHHLVHSVHFCVEIHRLFHRRLQASCAAGGICLIFGEVEVVQLCLLHDSRFGMMHCLFQNLYQHAINGSYHHFPNVPRQSWLVFFRHPSEKDQSSSIGMRTAIPVIFLENAKNKATKPPTSKHISTIY